MIVYVHFAVNLFLFDMCTYLYKIIIHNFMMFFRNSCLYETKRLFNFLLLMHFNGKSIIPISGQTILGPEANL